jgi:nucleoside-diphosphate-sugar epimerase
VGDEAKIADLMARADRLQERSKELQAESEVAQAHAKDAIRRGSEGADSVFHIGAVYKLGTPKRDRPGMVDANVRGTERVLDAAHAAGARRIVYASTVNVFGNTGGRMVDESYRRSEADGFLSCYDETKYRSHQVAEERIARGYPIVIVQPGGVYGPGDHSEVGNMIHQTRTGKLKAKAFPDMGIMLVHVEDVADGILLAHDRGEIGESYVLAGERTTMGDIVDRTAQIAGRRPPRMTMPSMLIRASAPLGPLVGPALGFPPNLRELVSASDGVTYWARDDKARRELGFQPRDMDTGLRQTLEASS